MAAEMSGGEEQEEVSILEKVLKILIVVLGLSMLYSYVEPIVTEVTKNAQNDRVTRDFTIIGDAILRFQLSGKKYIDTTLAGLLEKKLLEEMPKDPWGNEYVYNWCFEELISPGPNRVLNTFVPGLHPEANDAENDDKVRSIAPMSKFVYFTTTNGVSQIYKADVDGAGMLPIEEVQGEIKGLSIVPNTKLVVYAIKRNNTFDLRTIDFGTSQRTDLTSDAAQDLDPVWASLKNDLLIFSSDRDAPGVLSLFSMQLPAKTVTKLVDKPSEEPSPAVCLGDRRTLYYSAGGGDKPSSIQAITLPEAQSQEVLSGHGVVLHPSPSPNGSYLAYIVQEPQGASIEIIDLKSKKQIFKKDGASPKGYIAWSPDSDKLAYQTPEKDKAKLIVVEPFTGRTFVHPQFVMALGRFAWIK